jgi:hypothetical protein
MEAGRQGPLSCSYARSEKTGVAGSARSPSQTALHRPLPGDRFCGTAVGANFWFLAYLPVGFSPTDGGPAFSCVSVEGVGLRRYSLSEAGVRDAIPKDLN